MIPASYYLYIYLLVTAILSIVVFDKYASYPQSRLFQSSNDGRKIAFLLVLFVVMLIGFRPVDKVCFVDMYDYNAKWQMLNGSFYEFSWDTDNIIFDNLYKYLACSGVNVYVFFVGAAFLYFGGIYWACKKFFPDDLLAATLVYLAAFSTFSYATNGIKAGLGAALFLVALSYHHEKKWIGVLIFMLLSFGFHHSMIMPIAAYILCLLVKNPKIYFAFWFFAFLVALCHITFFQYLFGNLVDEQGAGYLLGAGNHVKTSMLGGFRADFIIYSVVPIVIGLHAVYKKKVKSPSYYFLLNFYTLTNAIWLLCMYAEFTNRIAYLSWFIYPIVLVYPYLKEIWSSSQYLSFKYVALGQLFFTLFMEFVYYA